MALQNNFPLAHPHILQGWKNPLEQKDMWRLGKRYNAEHLVANFDIAWAAEVKKFAATNTSTESSSIDKSQASTAVDLEDAKQSDVVTTEDSSKPTPAAPAAGAKGKGKKAPEGPSLISALYAVFIREIGPLGIIKSFPICGFGLIIGMFALQILGTLLLNNFFQLATASGMKMRTTLTAAIYRKSLRLSSAARQNFNSGKVINLVSTDCNRIEMFMTFIHILWTAPLQIVIIIGFLVSQLGWAALVGVCLLFVLTPVQGVVMKRLMNIRREVAPVTDSRVKLTTEVLNGIRVIKFFAWEVPFLKSIEELRRKEISLVFKRSIYQAFAMTIAFGVPILAAAIAFVIYGATNSLDASRVFSSLSWFAALRFPLMFLPNIVTGWADFKVAINRIEELLVAPELDDQPEIDPTAPHALNITDAEFTWEAPPPAAAKPDPKSAKKKKGKKAAAAEAAAAAAAEKKPSVDEPAKIKLSSLRNINLNVEKGSLVAVVGTVGSGKSSLLNAIVGEMKKNATLEQNITFGLPYDEVKYRQAVKDCALESDLKILPDGDQTSIGERGINLSGGQKQRVNLARCVYFDPEIVLLDDPLSAVDAHVGKYLFENCILGALKGKTRILVTHQLHFLSRVDHIVEQGSYSSLMEAGGEFATLITNYGAEEDAEEADEVDDKPAAALEKAVRKKSEIAEKAAVVEEEKVKKPANLIREEDRATGTVKGQVWWSYVVASGRWSFIIGIGNDLWLVWWSGNRFAGTFNLVGYIGVYCAWGVAQTLATYMFGIFFAFSGTRAARVLHEAAAAHQDGIDNTLSESYRMFANTLATSISTFVLICYATPLFTVVLIPLLGMIYRATSRELKRLDSVSRSPLYANFGETSRVSTIRAYREQNRFITNNDRATDANNSPYFLLLTAQRWLGLRLEILGGLLVFFASLFGILAKGSIDPGLLGLSLSYALQVTMILNWCIRQFTETEIAMNAVERVEHYGFGIDVEADAVIESNRPPKGWPSKGAIEFKDVEMRYAPGLPLVLKGVSFAIADGEKVGVVGRTGSGKSSLMQALFRMVEPAAGEIVVDGISSQTIGLSDLRSGLAIIPQDPVLFSGTFRTNLDPFSEHSDADLWDAITRSGLKSKVTEDGGEGLDGKVSDGGENLSVGQRQLLCLARAMLRKPKVLIMDEATANVDYETDALIQKALREDFAEATVLTIAHRLNTIIDYDRVMVMDAGRISEYDSPSNLLDRPDSKFRAMVAETGASNFEVLRAIARGEGNAAGFSGTAATAEDA
ncbi:P-loop containing nucleoside triphosphate hydrolase protein [Chytridium lagenaria]|nr:P-loop containing nucleoside triphosphate hydrolase protein [Chytridium lagenaria]